MSPSSSSTHPYSYDTSLSPASSRGFAKYDEMSGAEDFVSDAADTVLARAVRVSALAESQMIRARRMLTRALQAVDDDDDDDDEKLQRELARDGQGGGSGSGGVGADVEDEAAALETRRATRATMLLEAARCGSVVTVEMLLSSPETLGEDVERHLVAALHSSVVNGHDDVCLALVRSGLVDVDATVTEGTTLRLTALHLAAHSGTPTCVRILVAHGADVSLGAGFNGGTVWKTPLDIAMHKERPEIIAMLEHVSGVRDETRRQMRGEMVNAYQRGAREALLVPVYARGQLAAAERIRRRRRGSSGGENGRGGKDARALIPVPEWLMLARFSFDSSEMVSIVICGRVYALRDIVMPAAVSLLAMVALVLLTSPATDDVTYSNRVPT